MGYLSPHRVLCSALPFAPLTRQYLASFWIEASIFWGGEDKQKDTL